MGCDTTRLAHLKPSGQQASSHSWLAECTHSKPILLRYVYSTYVRQPILVVSNSLLAADVLAYRPYPIRFQSNGGWGREEGSQVNWQATPALMQTGSQRSLASAQL